MKKFYEEFKTNIKKEVLQHFNVDLTDDDDLDSKQNELSCDQHSEASDPILGWLMKWFERKKAERSREDLKRQQREASDPKKPHDEKSLDEE